MPREEQPHLSLISPLYSIVIAILVVIESGHLLVIAQFLLCIILPPLYSMYLYTCGKKYNETALHKHMLIAITVVSHISPVLFQFLVSQSQGSLTGKSAIPPLQYSHSLPYIYANVAVSVKDTWQTILLSGQFTTLESAFQLMCRVSYLQANLKAAEVLVLECKIVTQLHHVIDTSIHPYMEWNSQTPKLSNLLIPTSEHYHMSTPAPLHSLTWLATSVSDSCLCYRYCPNTMYALMRPH